MTVRRRFFPAKRVQQLPGKTVEIEVQVRPGAAAAPAPAPSVPEERASPAALLASIPQEDVPY